MTRSKTILTKVLVLSGVILVTLAVAKETPYQPIIERNAFGLRPLAPQGPGVVEPTPQRKVVLTGVSSLGGLKAFFQWPEPGPGKQMKLSPGMAQDEELDGIRVLDINVDKSEVRITNGTMEMTLNFEQNGVKTAGHGPTAPAALTTTTQRVPLLAPPAIRPTTQRSYEQSILSVAVATELTRDLVERGEHPPFPPTELTPDPTKLPGVPPQIATNFAPVPNVTVPRRIR